jgi:NADH dehydrogenase (ubiquinone) 1 alpha subcomplex subunit 8
MPHLLDLVFDKTHIPGPTGELDKTPAVDAKLDDELKDTLQQIKRGDLCIPSHALKAGAFQYAKQCGDINREYMLCKKEENDPRKCLKYSHKVSDCAADFYTNVTDVCGQQFTKLAGCLELNTRRSYQFCRLQQLDFDKCVYENLGYDKAMDAVDPGAKVQTDRPKPKNPYHIRSFEHPKPLLPDWDRPIEK